MKTSLTILDFVVIAVAMLGVAVATHFVLSYNLEASADGKGETLKPGVSFLS